MLCGEGRVEQNQATPQSTTEVGTGLVVTELTVTAAGNGSQAETRTDTAGELVS